MTYMIQPRRRLFFLTTLIFALLFTASSASAVLDSEAPGPLRIEMYTPDPSNVSSIWSRGKVSFTVSLGTELMLIGMEQEPYMKVAKEGGVYYNEHSSTWWGIVPGGTARMAKTAENFEFAVSPNWIMHEPGQTLRTFENRIDYYDNSIHPDIVDGTVLYEFKYKVLVDGEAFTYEGAMVFDSSLDPDFAASMKSRGLELLGDRYESLQSAPSDTRGTDPLVTIAAAVALVAVLGYALYRRSANRNLED